MSNAKRTPCVHCGAAADPDIYWETCTACLRREYDDGEGKSILDTREVHRLDGIHKLHTLVESTGDTVLWVVDTDDLDTPCKAVDWPAHELTGPLPNDVHVRVLRSRCGHLTRAGHPCRNGPWCKYHRPIEPFIRHTR
ncbi:MAG: hypothetical protein WBA05_17960 [Gordonia sp. (in: high G+C Gram-positive bacteria)]|uniref:hypothetical protein n=1 Tax=Gordonia sp. (in: high G+C Gram-positive bacteria) TaxID=84139 RepID=UPI003C74459C